MVRHFTFFKSGEEGRSNPRSDVLKLGALSAMFFLASATLRGQELDAKEFRQRYAPLAAKLAAYYNRIGIIIDYRKKATSARPEVDTDSERTRQLVYKSNDPYYQLESTAQIAGDESYERVSLINKQGVFSLFRSDHRRNYLLEKIGENYTQGRIDIQYSARVPEAAYAYDIPLVDLFTNRRYHIKKCVHEGNRYRLEYYWFGNRGIRVECQTILDADRCMAQVEHTLTCPDLSEKMTVRYDGKADGIPLVKRVDYTRTADSGTDMEVWDVEKYLPGPFPPSDFSLAAYGLNDRAFDHHQPLWPHLLVILSVAILLSVALWVLRRWRERVMAKRTDNGQ